MQSTREDLAQAEHKINELTSLLCEACQTLEDECHPTILVYCTEALKEWWKQHQAKDKQHKLGERRK